MTTEKQQKLTLRLARVLLASFLLLTGITRFGASDVSYYNKQLAVLNLPEMPWLSAVIGVLQFLVVLALILPRQKWSQSLLYLYGVLALVPMAMLFTHPVWIDSLGGFPAIGAGQGLIKYLGISGVSLYLASHYGNKDAIKGFSLAMIWAGVVLVMVWIGGMKFTQIEANGIEGLMRTSPFFSWIYDFMTVLEGSYFIGIVELVAVLGLALGLALILVGRPQQAVYFNMLGLFVAAATFAATQTFVVTLPAYDNNLGFLALNGSGQFIAKDLVLLAGTLLLFARLRRASPSSKL